MKIFLLSLMLFFLGTTGFCATWTISNSGSTFTPATISIASGDNVQFNLEDIHNAIEVSQATWNTNGISALTGGFQIPFGGGLVQASQLEIGTHYYVCTPHASSGMKGIIIVQSVTGIAENQFQPDFSVFPNPSKDLVTIKANDNVTGSDYFITDQAGRRVLTGKLESKSTPVDISHLPRGFYFIQVSGQRRAPVKVIKN